MAPTLTITRGWLLPLAFAMAATARTPNNDVQKRQGTPTAASFSVSSASVIQTSMSQASSSEFSLSQQSTQVSSASPSDVISSVQPSSTPAPFPSNGGSGGSSSQASVVSSRVSAGLGTTSENGQLVFRTTNAQGSTITFSGSAASSAITAPVTETTPLVASSTRPVTSVVVITTDGRTLSSTQTSNQVEFQTTGFATRTSTPQLNGSGGDNSGGTGLSSSSKKVIGGVVGGVGGAIVIGALALVAWRIWGRKKGAQEDAYAPGSPFQSGGGLMTEQRNSQGGSTTFSANGLERYGQGGGGQNVNTASNF